MKKLKYCLIINSMGLTPQTYSASYENETSINHIVATCSMEMTCDFVQKLAVEEYDIIDLCGDFDEEKTNIIRAVAGDQIRVQHAKYSKEESVRLENAGELNHYGFIAISQGAKDLPKRLELPSDEFHTSVSFVADLEMMCQEGKRMVNEGTRFIELCSYFHEEQAQMLGESIGHDVPVGYCG